MSLHVSTLGPSTPCFAFLHLSLLKRAESQRRSKNEHSKQLRNVNPMRSLEDFQVERVPANLKSSGYQMGLTMDCRLLGFKRLRGYHMMCKSIQLILQPLFHGSLQYIQGITQLSELLPCWQLAAIWRWKADFTKSSTRLDATLYLTRPQPSAFDVRHPVSWASLGNLSTLNHASGS